MLEILQWSILDKIPGLLVSKSPVGESAELNISYQWKI